MSFLLNRVFFFGTPTAGGRFMMSFFKQFSWGMLLSQQADLSSLCTIPYVKSVLPTPASVEGLVLLPDSVTSNPVTNYSIAASWQTPGKDSIDFCNVTVSYTHPGTDDTVNLWFWLPSPDAFQNRFLANGGGGFAITTAERSLGAGLVYGAATGTTDGGFGSWTAELTDVLLRGNGSLNYDVVNFFGYRATHEMSIIGKRLVSNFYRGPDAKAAPRVFSYYQGCSEGGREGWSQIQRYGNQFDGVVTGAPAFHWSFLQVLHLYGAAKQVAHDYFPPNCELSRIMQDAIDSCDALDGRVDGVVSRTDLCRLHYDAKSSVGKPYSCAATDGGNRFGPPRGPAVKGVVSEKAAALVSDLWRGFIDTQSGRPMFAYFPPSTSLQDASTAFNEETGQYDPSIIFLGVQFINMFLYELQDKGSALPVPMADLTVDTLKTWILQGIQKFGQVLETDWPELSPFRASGGKIIHWHGEADAGIPVGSSVLYHESVRKTMYPGMSYNASHDALAEWYRLFLVPGAGHCSPSPDQSNGPFPQTVLGSIIDWVEKGINPVQLNATLFGSGVEEKLCSFPLRPMWAEDGKHQCVYEQESLDTWFPQLDGFPLPVY